MKRRAYECRRYLEKTQWMKKRELQRLKLKRLKALLKYAYENVPYYHEAFRNSNFKPDDFRGLKDLHRVPILKKQTIRKNLEQLLAKNFPKKKRICRFTTGTTATPVKFYRDKRDVSWGIGAELRGYGWAGYEVGDKLALIWNIRPELSTSFNFKIENLWRRCNILNIRDLSEKSMESFARRLQAFQPDFIRGHSGATNIFATFLLQNDHIKIHPRAIFTSCDSLLPQYRGVIREAFNCKVYNYYACAEVSHIAAQCGQHEGLHIFEENIVVETVKDGESTAPEEDGHVLLTNLHSFAMPFIRYEIGDSGKILSDACSCGRELTLLKLIGRINEYFANSDGSFTFLKDFQRFFEDLPVQDFQIIQEHCDEIFIKIMPGANYTEAHTRFILRNIRLLGPEKIKVELVDSIPPGKTGKIRHLVSKVATKYT